EIEVRLHGFCRIHVDVLHEPARLVGPDREERQIDWAQPNGDLPEMRAVARVSGGEYSVPTGLDEEPAPQRAVPIEHAPRGEVLSGRQRDREWCGARGLPPGHLLYLADARRPEQPAITERCHERWMKAPLESLQGREIAVIVVI